MINELDLLWLPNFIALAIYFIFGTKFSRNGGIDTCFNVECVLLGRNFYFLGGFVVFTAHYLVVTARYPEIVYMLLLFQMLCIDPFFLTLTLTEWNLYGSEATIWKFFEK